MWCCLETVFHYFAKVPNAYNNRTAGAVQYFSCNFDNKENIICLI